MNALFLQQDVIQFHSKETQINQFMERELDILSLKLNVNKLAELNGKLAQRPKFLLTGASKLPY